MIPSKRLTKCGYLSSNNTTHAQTKQTAIHSCDCRRLRHFPFHFFLYLPHPLPQKKKDKPPRCISISLSIPHPTKEKHSLDAWVNAYVADCSRHKRSGWDYLPCHTPFRARLQVASPIIWLSHVTWHRWSDLPPHVDGRYVAVASSRSTDRSIGQTLAFHADNEKSQSAVWYLPEITFFFFFFYLKQVWRNVRSADRIRPAKSSGLFLKYSKFCKYRNIFHSKINFN